MVISTLFCLLYEDGYGIRPDAEEDGHAESGALEVAKGIAQNSLSPFIGIRIKPFSKEFNLIENIEDCFFVFEKKT